MTEPPPTIVFHALHPDVQPPGRATSESAGYDLRAWLRGRTVRIGGIRREERSTGDAAELRLAPGEIALVPLGFRARLPAGYEAQIRIRSSVAFRKVLTIPNAPGTIDADYPDEWMVMLANHSPDEVVIEHGERIAQAVLSRYAALDWEAGEVGIRTERTGGVGSTGRF
jgi:dUTP pyrophosphatase